MPICCPATTLITEATAFAAATAVLCKSLSSATALKPSMVRFAAIEEKATSAAVTTVTPRTFALWDKAPAAVLRLQSRLREQSRVTFLTVNAADVELYPLPTTTPTAGPPTASITLSNTTTVTLLILHGALGGP